MVEGIGSCIVSGCIDSTADALALEEFEETLGYLAVEVFNYEPMGSLLPVWLIFAAVKCLPSSLCGH